MKHDEGDRGEDRLKVRKTGAFSRCTTTCMATQRKARDYRRKYTTASISSNHARASASSPRPFDAGREHKRTNGEKGLVFGSQDPLENTNNGRVYYYSNLLCPSNCNPKRRSCFPSIPCHRACCLICLLVLLRHLTNTYVHPRPFLTSLHAFG